LQFGHALLEGADSPGLPLNQQLSLRGTLGRHGRLWYRVWYRLGLLPLAGTSGQEDAQCEPGENQTALEEVKCERIDS
jgi:hypothetical protein